MVNQLSEWILLTKRLGLLLGLWFWQISAYVWYTFCIFFISEVHKWTITLTFSIFFCPQQHGQRTGQCHVWALQEWLRSGREDSEQQRGTLSWAVLRLCAVFPAVPRGALLRGNAHYFIKLIKKKLHDTVTLEIKNSFWVVSYFLNL